MLEKIDSALKRVLNFWICLNGLNEKEHERAIGTLVLSSALWYTTDEINQYS
jgi:hypothetical protein